MRQVSRFGYRARILRRPPPGRWSRVRRVLLTLVLPLAVIGTAVAQISSTPWAQARMAEYREGVGAWIARSGLALAHVESHGRERTSAYRVGQTLAPFIGGSILTLDLQEARERVEALPWVESASLQRQLPDRLVARVREHRPLALWRSDGRTWLVNHSGHAVDVGDFRDLGHLRVLRGAGAPARAHEVLALTAREPELDRRVTGAALVAERRWTVLLDGRVQVHLPAQDAPRAWARLADLQARHDLLARAVDTIDLRLRDRVILRLHDDLIRMSRAHPI